jgi:hypothetical protein
MSPSPPNINVSDSPLHLYTNGAGTGAGVSAGAGAGGGAAGGAGVGAAVGFSAVKAFRDSDGAGIGGGGGGGGSQRSLKHAPSADLSDALRNIYGRAVSRSVLLISRDISRQSNRQLRSGILASAATSGNVSAGGSMPPGTPSHGARVLRLASRGSGWLAFDNGAAAEEKTPPGFSLPGAMPPALAVAGGGGAVGGGGAQVTFADGPGDGGGGASDTGLPRDDLAESKAARAATFGDAMERRLRPPPLNIEMMSEGSAEPPADEDFAMTPSTVPAFQNRIPFAQLPVMRSLAFNGPSQGTVRCRCLCLCVCVSAPCHYSFQNGRHRCTWCVCVRVAGEIASRCSIRRSKR